MWMQFNSTKWHFRLLHIFRIIVLSDSKIFSVALHETEEEKVVNICFLSQYYSNKIFDQAQYNLYWGQAGGVGSCTVEWNEVLSTRRKNIHPEKTETYANLFPQFLFENRTS
jgi:hypothetical protein